jgi:hypothetical protein
LCGAFAPALLLLREAVMWREERERREDQRNSQSV